MKPSGLPWPLAGIAALLAACRPAGAYAQIAYP